MSSKVDAYNKACSDIERSTHPGDVLNVCKGYYAEHKSSADEIAYLELKIDEMNEELAELRIESRDCNMLVAVSDLAGQKLVKLALGEDFTGEHV